MFELHPKLAADCIVLGEFELSLLLLSKDSRYPWCILVPRRPALTEIHDLDRTGRIQLMDESCLLAETMTALFNPDKMNVAVLGNLVPQLHMHHVARYTTDAAWPGPIWGVGERQDYSGDDLAKTVAGLRLALSAALKW